MPPDLTPLQYELVTVLLPQPGATLRWYSHQHPNKDLSGRGELQGLSVRHGRHWKGGLIAGYTIRVLVGFGYLSPINKANAAPFSAGGPPHRDYHLDPRNHRPRGPK